MAAEGLGLAASIAGLLSLGLQVADGISKYVDALDRREDDLVHVKSQNQALIMTLSALEVVASSLPNQRMAFTSRVVQDIQGCRQGLGDVERLRIDLTYGDLKDWKTRMENKKKKFTYKFHESKMQQLAERLQQSNHVLQLTLSGLELEISMLNTTKLTAIESSSRSLASGLLQIRSSIESIRAPSISMSNQISGLHDSIRSVPQLLEQQSDLIVHRIQGNSRTAQEDMINALQMNFKQQQDVLDSKFGQLFQMMQVHHQWQYSRMSNNSRIFVAPSVIRELCDDIKQTKQRHESAFLEGHLHHPVSQNPASVSRLSSQSNSVTGRICICHRLQRVAKLKGIRLRHVYLYSERKSLQHWPGCPYSKNKATSETRTTWSVRYTGLTRLLNTAVNFSFACTSGPGGLSIGPSLNYIPTVDVRTDAAFRVLALIREAFVWRTCTNREVLMTACHRKLVKIFDGKRAHPWSVNQKNETLMHYTASMLQRFTGNPYWEPTGPAFFLELFQTLARYGVPVFSYDTKGFSPLTLMGTRSLAWTQDAIKFFVQANLQDQPAALNAPGKSFTLKIPGLGNNNFDTVAHRNFMYQKFPSFAEACECGPLSLAVIRHDTYQVSRILHQSSDSLAERDIYGQSPIHLAAGNPQVLSLLMAVAALGALELRDDAGLTALQVAMRFSSVQCVNGSRPDRCRHCPCTECVELFLQAGCHVRMHPLHDQDRETPTMESILSGASELARRRFVFQMSKLRGSRHRATELYPTFPKGQTSNPRTSKRKNQEADRCSTTSAKQSPVYGIDSEEGRWAWMYLETDDPRLADLFFRHGFRPHPALFAHLPWIKRSHLPRAYMCWLIDHGVDLLMLSTQRHISDTPFRTGLYGAHYAFFLSAWRIIVRNEPPPTSDELAFFNKHCEAIERCGLTDGCFCFCAPAGCRPFIWMLKGKMYMTSDLHDAARSLSLLYRECSTEVTKLTCRAAIRFATFQVLGLKHTCCSPADVMFRRSWTDSDDVDVINGEQESDLELHEKLVKDFEEKAIDYIDRVTGKGTAFPDFWCTYWVVRMREVLEKLNGDELTDEEIRGGEQIGVRWCAPPGEEQEEEDSLHEYGSLEYYLDILDSICPEYNEPWPDGLH